MTHNKARLKTPKVSCRRYIPAKPIYTQFYVEYWKPINSRLTKFMLLPDGTEEKGGLRTNSRAFVDFDEAYQTLCSKVQSDWQYIELTALAEDTCKVHNYTPSELKS